jgi:hypothetical protein
MMQKTTIVHHGRVGLLSFFYHQSTRGAEFLFVLSIHAMDQ